MDNNFYIRILDENKIPLFLKKLEHMLYTLERYQNAVNREEWLVKAFKKAIYSTVVDLRESGKEAEVREILHRRQYVMR